MNAMNNSRSKWRTSTEGVTPEHRATFRRGMAQRWSFVLFYIRRIESQCVRGRSSIFLQSRNHSCCCFSILIALYTVVEILENFPINGPAKGIARLTAAVVKAPVPNVKCG